MPFVYYLLNLWCCMSVFNEIASFQGPRPGRNLHSVTELFYVTASVAEESSGGKSGYPRSLFICNRSITRGGLRLIGNVSQNILPTVGLSTYIICVQVRTEMRKKRLTPPFIDLGSFIKCMLIWTEG